MTPEQDLRRHPLFALLTADEMAGWLACASESAFQTGETVFRQGTLGVAAYLILDGRVRVLRTNADEDDVTLGTMSRGEVFGEYALIRPGLNTATSRAAAASRLLRLPLDPLMRILEGRPDVMAQLKNWLRLNALIQHLRWRAFLGFLSAPSALKHLPYLESATLPRLCTIQADGLSDDRWYYVEGGRAWLHGAGDGPPRELGPGDWFGEQALLGRRGLPTVVAECEVRCRTLTREAFSATASPGARDGLSQTIQLRPGPTRGFEWVGQPREADCGLASLAMVARSRGLAVTVDQLRERLVPGERGVSLMALHQLAGAVGLPCAAIRIGPGQWSQVRLPAVAHLSEGHYVVLFELRDGVVRVADPATGVLTETLAGFRRRCSGTALVFSPREQPQATT